MSRILLTEVLAFRSTGFIMDTLISTFPKILYTTDVMDALKVGSLSNFVVSSNFFLKDGNPKCVMLD